MPPRFRRPDLMTFELVPDDEREDDADLVPDDPEPGQARRWLAELRDRAVARWRALSRGGRVAVAASTAAVVVAAATAGFAPGLLDARAERLRAEAVHGLPGAVGDLSEPLTERWELTDGTDELTTLAGGLVLTTQGTDAVATDAGTGREAWRHDVGPYPTCGPQGSFRGDASTPATIAVCLSGAADDRRVTVLDADGAVLGERPFGPARSDAYDEAAPPDAPVVVPAAGGALAVAEGVTDATAPWPPDGVPDADTLRRLRADGWVDPTLRVEDALTGEVRGEATLRLRPEDLEQCGMMQDGGAEPEVMINPAVGASPTDVTMSVCSTSVLMTPGGTVIDAATDGWTQPLPGGRHVVVSDQKSTVLDDDGTVVATVPGWLVPPAVDDDPDGSFLVLPDLGQAVGQLQLRAIGADGAEQWHAPLDDIGGVLARVAGVVVVQDGGELVGLDAATGAEIWARDDLLRRTADGSGDWLVGAVTDGTRLLVGISGDGDRRRLVALDLRDGVTAWDRLERGYLGQLQSVGGHVVVVDDTVHGLG
ncbi:outer membrane protein assembly factor BamB family protein [Isoptericola sp. NPDC055881]